MSDDRSEQHTEPRMPGIALTAAVLGFVEAGIVLAAVAVTLLSTSLAGGDPPASEAQGALLAIALSGLVLVGSVSVLQRRSRQLLTGGTVVEIVLVAGVGLMTLLAGAGDLAVGSYTRYDGLSAPESAAAALAVLALGLTLPVLRLSLITRPSVDAWLDAPQSASDADHQGVGLPRRGHGVALAVLVPAAVLFIATGLTLLRPEPPPGYDASDDSSRWSYLYDGGAPVEPPAPGDAGYDEMLSLLAQECYDVGSYACNFLWDESESGTVYDWLGTTCGGRELYATPGTCV